MVVPYVPVWVRNSNTTTINVPDGTRERKNAEWKPFSINNIQNTVIWDYLSSFNSVLSPSNFSDNLFNFFNFSVVADLLSGYMIPPSSSIYGLSG